MVQKGGYTQLELMFRKTLKELADRYGVFIIAHPNQKQEEVEGQKDKNQYWDLAVNKKVKGIAIGIMDLLIFVEHNRRPNVPNIAHFYASDGWEAKTRFSKIVPSVEFSYENIRDAVKKAAGADATTEVNRTLAEPNSISPEDFSKFKQEINEFAQQRVAEKGLEPVKQKINFILNKPLSSADISDYERLVLLEDELRLL